MRILKFISKNAKFFFVGITILSFLSSCGIYAPSDARKVSPNVDERVRQNIEEGRGIGGMGGILGKGDGSFQFATSNEMWRASLEILDFIPLANADYAGGIIITDWYTEENTNNEALKITIRFLSNEIRADGLEIYIYKKKCNTVNNCTVRKISSSLEQELKVAILKKAAILQKETTAYKRKIIRKRRGTVLDVDNQKAKGP